MPWPYRKKKWRDRIIADYLTRSGAERFDPEAFVEWLRDKPEHEAHALFHGN